MLLDVAVGTAFVAVALVGARASPAMSGWWAAVGLAWWIGDLVPHASVAHQGLLLAALGNFPTGRARTRTRWVLLGCGAVIGSGFVTQGVTGLVYVLTAVVGAGRRWFARGSAGLVGGCLLCAFIWSRAWPESYLPSRALVAYELILLVVAVALPWGIGAEARRRDSLADRALGTLPGGLSGLELTLRRMLRRPALNLVRTGDEVAVGGLGTVDAETERAVEKAIALTLEHERSVADAASRLHELEAARTRLLAVTDVERERAADRLRHGLQDLRACRPPMSALVRDELAATVADIERILAGLPPPGLGAGGIGPALDQLCARHPVPVQMRLEPGASADQATETALFYVCSEALANSLKHSGARSVEVTLQSGDPIVLTVTDDGTGGADPEGPGLTGLRDRVGALGGALLVESAAAGGTRVQAQLPRELPYRLSRSGRTASGPSPAG